VSDRRLIVSGDDFGAAAEVNAGIIRAHRDGVLTSTSLMVTGDAVAEAAALAHANPRLAVGLHLVLAQGRPAAAPRDVSALVRPDGGFGDQPVLNGLRYAWAYCSQAGRAQLRREVEAQLEAFAATGLRLAHVDGHLNMHLHPMVLPLLLELAPRFGIRAMRLTREAIGPALRYDRSHVLRKLWEGFVFSALSAWATPRLRAAGIASADRIFGLHQTGHLDARYLTSLIPALPAGTSEVYCHPADGTPAVLSRYQPGYDHAGELSALVDPRVRAAIDAAGVTLVSYRDL
jgi:hopanoid biosynthesis associated protein HpnK